MDSVREGDDMDGECPLCMKQATPLKVHVGECMDKWNKESFSIPVLVHENQFHPVSPRNMAPPAVPQLIMLALKSPRGVPSPDKKVISRQVRMMIELVATLMLNVIVTF